MRIYRHIAAAAPLLLSRFLSISRAANWFLFTHSLSFFLPSLIHPLLLFLFLLYRKAVLSCFSICCLRYSRLPPCIRQGRRIRSSRDDANDGLHQAGHSKLPREIGELHYASQVWLYSEYLGNVHHHQRRKQKRRITIILASIFSLQQALYEDPL